MAFLRKKNNAKTTINQVGGLTASALSVTVADASKFPDTGDFLVTAWNKTLYPDPTDDINREILKVTNVVGNVLTIERGQEDTTAHVHANGQAVEMLITAGTFEEIENAILVSSNLEIIGENLSSQANGSNTTFTLANDYVANSTKLFINGMRMTRGDDYTEVTDNTIEIPIVVESGEKVVIDYIIA